MSTFPDFAAVLSGFEHRTDKFTEDDVFGKLAALAESVGESAITDDFRSELAAFAVPEHRDWKSGQHFYLEIDNLSEQRLNYWERRATESTHPLLKWRYAALAIQARGELKLRSPNTEMRTIAIDQVVMMAKSPFGGFDLVSRLARAYSHAVILKDSQRIAEVCDAIVNCESTIASDNLPGTWGFSFDVLVSGSKKQISDEREAEIVASLRAIFGRLSQSIAETTAVHVMDRAIERLAAYYRRTGNDTDLADVLNKYAERVMAIAQSSIGTDDVMESLRAIDCLTRAARTCIAFGQRELESRLMVLKAQVQEHMPRIPPTCVSEFTIDVEKLRNDVDDMLKNGVDAACSQLALTLLPIKEELEDQLRDQERSAPFYSTIPLTMIDETNRDVATAGSVEGDFTGRTVRSLAENLPVRAAYLKQFLLEIFKRHPEVGDSIVAQVHLSPLFSPENREIVQRGVTAYFSEDYIVATHLLVPQIESAVRRLAGFLGSQTMKEKRGRGGTALRLLDDLLRDDDVAAVLGDNLSLYLKTVLTDSLGWNIRNRVCHALLTAKGFDWMKSVLVLHAILLLGHIIPRQEQQPPSPPK